jgi:hypothetical protein
MHEVSMPSHACDAAAQAGAEGDVQERRLEKGDEDAAAEPLAINIANFEPLQVPHGLQ